MIVYLLKMTLCASLLLLVYHFFLEKEKMHHFKRFYLLMSLVFAAVVPFIEISVLTDIPMISEQIILLDNYGQLQGSIVNDATIMQTSSPVVSVSDKMDWSTILSNNWILALYIIVCTVLLIRFCVNIYRLIELAKGSKVLIYHEAKLIIAENDLVPHSFFNYIFVNRHDFEHKNIKKEIFLHELTHVRQKHTLDVVFIELLSVFLWFNPIIYLYKSKIKLNHEFLADENVIDNYSDISHYQLILLDEVNKNNKLSLASNFNYLITKKRLIMMSKITSKRKILCKAAMIVPLFAIAISVFSTKTMTEKVDMLAKTVEESTGLADNIIIPENGVSQAELNEYKKITDKYIRSDAGSKEGDKVEWNSMDLSNEDRDRLYILYVKMTKEQRYSTYIHFSGPLSPFKLRNPNKDEWRACINPKNQIWLDGKGVNGADLKSYSRHNIVFFVYSWAKKEGEVSKVHLWTKKVHDEYLATYKKGISESDLLKIRPMTSFTVGKGRAHLKNT
ncbi:MAG: M56 family metallopeptidase [Dysgonomonas sp.]